MPRSGASVYSKPAGTTPVDGDILNAAPFNLLMDDIAADLNLPRPIAVGGTGASTAGAALTALGLSANAKSFVTAADYAAMRTALGVGAVADFATAAQGALADLAAPLESPTFTGTPLAPTATAGTNTTQIATTAFAKALVDAQAIGAGQTWQTPTRTHSTSYQNTTGRSIQLFIGGSSGATGRFIEASSTGAFAGEQVSVGVVGGSNPSGNPIIPAGHYYRVNGSTTISTWSELRT
jgi:hypothetical protein